MARGSYRQQSVGRCCGGRGHNWVGELCWLHHRGWRRKSSWLHHGGLGRKSSWVLVSHHWGRRGKMDWLRDRKIRGLVVMSQASTRDSLSSGGEVGSRTGDRERY